MTKPWYVELLGGLQAKMGDQIVTRFQTQKNALLLACLAFYMDRPHPRELLVEMLWPDVDPDVGRNRLRQALSSLRHQLEPPELPGKSVLIAERIAIRLNSQAVTTDVGRLEQALRNADRARETAQIAFHLAEAVDLYRGELLPGYYEEWVIRERERLHHMVSDALRRLIELSEQAEEYERARDYAQRLIRLDALDEIAHQSVMRLNLILGQPALALRQYREFEETLRTQLGQTPSPATRNLFRKVSEFIARVPESESGILLPSAPPPSGAEDPDITITRQPSLQSEREASEHKASEQKASEREASEQETRGSAPGSDSPELPETSDDSEKTEIRLPIQFARFFGREKEIAGVLALLSGADEDEDALGSDAFSARNPHRLVTLTGSGGCGKTRLAIEVARQYGLRSRRSVDFVPLASLTDPLLIPIAIAGALGITLSANSDPFSEVVRRLSQRPALLVLDNLEQLLNAVPQNTEPPLEADNTAHAAQTTAMLRNLLEQVPSLVCLVTSSQCLNIAGEHEFPLLPLATPKVDLALPIQPSALLRFPSVQLFVDRAQAICPDFQVTPRTAATLATLIDRLDGLPLAIELAAAWTQTLTATQMLKRIEHRFELLVSRRGDLPARHRALNATIEWSYNLLSSELRTLFLCLSVFRNGWSLEAATAVCSSDVANTGDQQTARGVLTGLLPSSTRMIDALRQLRSRSLVFAVEQQGEMRWQMLEALREFATEMCSHDDHADLAGRHARYFLQMAEQLAPQLWGAQQDHASRLLDAERDNLRAAVEWSLENDPIIGLRLTAALWRYWALAGRFREGRAWLDRVLRSGVEAEPAYVVALAGAGVLAHHQSDYTTALRLFEQALTIYRHRNDRTGIANMLNHLGRVYYHRGDYANAQTNFEQSLSILRELNDVPRIAVTLNNFGVMAYDIGEYARAAELLEESLIRKRALGDRQGIAVTLNNLVARAFFEESLAINRDMNNASVEATNRHNLARTLLAEGDYRLARSELARGLAIRNEGGDRHGIAFSLEGCAELAAAEQGFEFVPRLFGAASVLRELVGAPVPRTDIGMHERISAQARAVLGEKRYEADYRLGRAMPLEQIIDFALTLLHSSVQKIER